MKTKTAAQTVYLDYDATLVDLMTPWLSWLSEAHGISITCRDIPHFGFVEATYGAKTSDLFRSDGVYGIVSPLPGAQEFVEALKSRFGDANVLVISASYDNHRKEKEEHARRHFGIGKGRFLHSGSKHLHTGHGILIDDHPGHVVRHIRANSSPGVIYTGGGEYAWANPENYGFDPSFLAAANAMDKRLLRVCGTYGEILSALPHGEARRT